MKTTIKFLIYVLIIVNVAYAQWLPDVRLTNDPFPSSTSYNNAWCIASSGNTLHVVWDDTRDGVNGEIYYKRSTDGGLSWGTDTRLTNNSSYSYSPSVTVSGSVVHVVWFDSRDNNYEIYYKRSTDGGVSWGTDTRLTNNVEFSQYPSVTVSGSVVHVVWDDTRDGNYEIYYKRSTDGGISFGVDTRFTNNTAISFVPSVSVSGSVIHIVWDESRDGNREIYYKRSTDGGINFGADARLTNNSADSELPSLSVSGLVVHVVWGDRRDGNREIYYKRSTDGGISWGTDTRLTNNSADSFNPSVTVSGAVVHVVWGDARDGNYELYYKCSTDGGVSWGADIRLTNDPDNSYFPSVSVSGSVVHVVWTDRRNGNGEIYYKRDPTGNPVGIINVNTEIPNSFSLSQNYPNPFNPTTKIRFDLPKNSFVKIVVYDALGREVETLVSEQLKAGTYEANWNAEKLSSAIYFYTLSTGNYNETKKMILIK